MIWNEIWYIFHACSSEVRERLESGLRFCNLEVARHYISSIKWLLYHWTLEKCVSLFQAYNMIYVAKTCIMGRLLIKKKRVIRLTRQAIKLCASETHLVLKKDTSFSWSVTNPLFSSIFKFLSCFRHISELSWDWLPQHLSFLRTL